MIAKNSMKISVLVFSMLIPLLASMFLPGVEYGSSVMAAEEKKEKLQELLKSE